MGFPLVFYFGGYSHPLKVKMDRKGGTDLLAIVILGGIIYLFFQFGYMDRSINYIESYAESYEELYGNQSLNYTEEDINSTVESNLTINESEDLS